MLRLAFLVIVPTMAAGLVALSQPGSGRPFYDPILQPAPMVSVSILPALLD